MLRPASHLTYLLVVLMVSGCAEETPLKVQRTFDSQIFATLPLPDLGFGTTPLPENVPKRVISLIPSVTELIFTLGAGEALVGRSTWCDWPPEARSRVDLGRFESFSKERIVDLHPDLVILFQTQDALARSLLSDFNIRVLTPPTERVEEIFVGIREVANALGIPERGEVLVARLQSDLDVLRAQRRAGTPERVLVVLDRDPLYVPGKNSFLHELLLAIGVHNLGAEVSSDSAWPTVSLECVLDWDPDLILDLTIGTGAAASVDRGRSYWGRFTNLKAVRSGRVVFLEAGVLVRPGPRMALAAMKLAEVIHGR